MAHWAKHQERGNAFVLRLTSFLAMHSPLWLLRVVVSVVVFFYYVIEHKARRNITQYQQYIKQTFPQKSASLASPVSVFKQFYQFGLCIVDRFAVWQGRIRYADLTIHDYDNIHAEIDRKGQRGQMLICSHLGNVDIARALVEHHQGFVMNVLMHSGHAVEFNRQLQKAGASHLNVIEVSTLDATVMMELQQRLERGEWLAMAADRIPIRGNKNTRVNFLGHSTIFPQGPWLLASLLRVPVNVLFCLKEHNNYHLYLERMVEQVSLPRGKREESIQAYAQQYADILAKYCCQSPWQWFNFFEFWNQDDKSL